MVMQMIVEGKSWKEADNAHAVETGAISGGTSLACGGFAKTALGQKKAFKTLRADKLSEANDKELRKVQAVKTEEKLVQKNGNNEIGKRAAIILAEKPGEYKKALQKYAHYNFMKKEVEICQGWLKQIGKAGMVCAIKEGGIKK